jgi:integrase
MSGSCHYNEGSKRWFISLYWQGKRYKIWKYNGEPLWAEKTAQKLVSRIRTEIDDGTFLVKAYLPDSPVSLKEISKAWFSVLSVTPATKKFYEKAISHSIKYFGEDQDIRKFHHSQLQTFYNDLHLTIKGKYHVLNTLKTMLRFAYQDEIIKKVPPFPKLPQAQKDEIKYLTYEEQEKVLSLIKDREIFELAMIYGLRIGEICALQKDCITETEIIISRAVSNGKLEDNTKTKKTRRYGITPRAREILDSLPKQFSPYVFVRPDGKPFTWKALTKRWRTATKKAGIAINLYNGIRHSLGCQLMDENIEMEMVRDILGHSSTNTTRMYAKRSSASMTNVLQFRGNLRTFKEQKNTPSESVTS